MSNSDHPTERIRTDEALQKRLHDDPQSWSDITRNEMLIAAVSKSIHSEQRAKRSSIKSTVSLVAAIIGSLVGVGTIVGYAKKFAVFSLSQDFATAKDVKRIDHTLTWFIGRMLPGEKPPSFEEREQKEEQK